MRDLRPTASGAGLASRSEEGSTANHTRTEFPLVPLAVAKDNATGLRAGHAPLSNDRLAANCTGNGRYRKIFVSAVKTHALSAVVRHEGSLTPQTRRNTLSSRVTGTFAPISTLPRAENLPRGLIGSERFAALGTDALNGATKTCGVFRRTKLISKRFWHMGFA